MGRPPRHSGSLSKAERLAAILNAIEQTGAVEVNDLAARFAVSPASLRRDLRILENQGLLRRTYGGAVASARGLEVPVGYRGETMLAHKRAIAAAAAREVPTGRVAVGLNGGTTMLHVAHALPDRPDLVAVTNSVDVAAELMKARHSKVFLLGGQGRRESHETVGRLTEMMLGRVTLDTAFLGADGLSAASGLTTHDEAEASANRAMAARASRVVAVVDSSKIGKATPATILPVTGISQLVTDANADPGELAALRAAGCIVTTVSPSPELLVRGAHAVRRI